MKKRNVIDFVMISIKITTLWQELVTKPERSFLNGITIIGST